MTEEQTKHPLHGVGLKAMLTELVDHYDWEILADQIPIKCFDSYPSIKSSVKFLHKTEWARQRVEAFYLYRFKNLPLPSDEEHALPPRERNVPLDQLDNKPAEVLLGDAEFFDDPISGPKMPSKKSVERTRAKKADKPSRRQSQYSSNESHRDTETVSQNSVTTKSETQSKSDKVVDEEGVDNQEPNSGSANDPWAKWRK